MSVAKKLTTEQIDTARAKIIELFIAQCEYGEQTTRLANSALAACGQFIGEGAQGMAQRGLHGTSAAIAVLADVPYSPKASSLMPRLVKYANDRNAVEEATGGSVWREHVDLDDDNIIKISELLTAIASVPITSVPNTEELRRHLAKWLKESRIQDRGWSYFRSESSPGPQLLPTAYAVMALDAVDEDVTGPMKFMQEKIRETTGGAAHGSDADVTIRTLALYVLTYSKHANQRVRLERRIQEELFDGLWQRLEPLLRTESIEQNVEYWRGNKTFYVRVPWQLYLLALAAKIRIRRFAAKGAQVRVCEIVSSLGKGQFRYPYSGRMISSRTNAIAYEALGHVRSEIERSKSFGAFVWMDRTLSWGGWRLLAFLIATAIICYSGWSWISSSGQKAFIDLAPNFVCSLVIYILLWARRR
jgi:hypothetical protein